MPLLSNLSEMYWCVYITSMSTSLSVSDISSLANNQFVWLIQGETQQVKTQLVVAFLTCSYYIPKHPEYTFRWLFFKHIVFKFLLNYVLILTILGHLNMVTYFVSDTKPE